MEKREGVRQRQPAQGRQRHAAEADGGGVVADAVGVALAARLVADEIPQALPVFVADPAGLGQARVEAESAWQSISNLPLHIFRLAGIYGPGRGPFEKVRKGTARRIIKDGQVFSRIHVDDIAHGLELSLASPMPGAIFNMCDDDPAPPQDVIGHAAELLGLPTPPAVAFETADLTPMARSFYAESKRVRNDHIKRALGWEPSYADYRSGLAAMLAQSGKTES